MWDAGALPPEFPQYGDLFPGGGIGEFNLTVHNRRIALIPNVANLVLVEVVYRRTTWAGADLESEFGILIRRGGVVSENINVPWIHERKLISGSGDLVIYDIHLITTPRPVTRFTARFRLEGLIHEVALKVAEEQEKIHTDISINYDGKMSDVTPVWFKFTGAQIREVGFPTVIDFDGQRLLDIEYSWSAQSPIPARPEAVFDLFGEGMTDTILEVPEIPPFQYPTHVRRPLLFVQSPVEPRPQYRFVPTDIETSVASNLPGLAVLDPLE